MTSIYKTNRIPGTDLYKMCNICNRIHGDVCQGPQEDDPPNPDRAIHDNEEDWWDEI